MSQFRKARGITQVQLATALGVSQQTYQSYEVGRRRIQVSALPVVARALSVSLEDLFGESDSPSRSKRGPAPKWQKQIEAIAQLPKAKQQFVAQVLDSVLAQAQR
ncbi:helix-turn-helix domain-containing protein [Paraburkholderia graminis]|uniref:helix-turn-helix domain-containing protein n=1 Tax=Paraburkholderia graminis TaxID=60548 RepID=UPI002794A14C|nr:helix-turn-helix transcriptional regulator [Paraburkholderia graminis]MDQ0625873.1 transcriptional regulator with XRE-family HTH domain [Paraburkholderia graminis]